jgi:hypothetical protein
MNNMLNNIQNTTKLIPSSSSMKKTHLNNLKQIQPPNTQKEIVEKFYGYSTNPVQKYDDIIPMSFFEFVVKNMKKELTQKRYGFDNDPYYNCKSKNESYSILRLRKSLKKLQLNDENIWKREQERDHINCPRPMMIIYHTLCHTLDIIYKNKPIERFWFLESVARMPYFSYVATLHLYETLGWWELDSSLKKKHYEEESNETHHLKIMESLGGHSKWWNRLLARHISMMYYIVLMILFMASPRLAYLSSELLEMHAVDTYTEFYESNKSILKQLPPNKECLEYFKYAENLYDVFYQIANDEYKHALNMRFVKNLPNEVN